MDGNKRVIPVLYASRILKVRFAPHCEFPVVEVNQDKWPRKVKPLGLFSNGCIFIFTPNILNTVEEINKDCESAGDTALPLGIAVQSFYEKNYKQAGEKISFNQIYYLVLKHELGHAKFWRECQKRNSYLNNDPFVHEVVAWLHALAESDKNPAVFLDALRQFDNPSECYVHFGNPMAVAVALALCPEYAEKEPSPTLIHRFKKNFFKRALNGDHRSLALQAQKEFDYLIMADPNKAEQRIYSMDGLIEQSLLLLQ